MLPGGGVATCVNNSWYMLFNELTNAFKVAKLFKRNLCRQQHRVYNHWFRFRRCLHHGQTEPIFSFVPFVPMIVFEPTFVPFTKPQQQPTASAYSHVVFRPQRSGGLKKKSKKTPQSSAFAGKLVSLNVRLIYVS